MPSRSFSERRFPSFPDTASDPKPSGDHVGGDEPLTPRCRDATVYDAVAGRLFVTQDSSFKHFGKSLDQAGHDGSTVRPRKSSGTRRRPLAPEEVLFRRRNAPPRYAEYDIYMACERDLPGERRSLLPDSDLLGAIHFYASHYYAELGRRTRNPIRWAGLDRKEPARREYSHQEAEVSIDERSMDETALLAFGILLEEAAKEVLGRRGDLVFTEGIKDDGQDERDEATTQAQSDGHGNGNIAGEGGTGSGVVGVEDTGSWRRAKRRKIRAEADTEADDERAAESLAAAD